VKNKKHTIETLPASVRTRSSKKLAGTRTNKPKYRDRKKYLESWNKSHCRCGTLMVACPLFRTLTKWSHDGWPNRYDFSYPPESTSRDFPSFSSYSTYMTYYN
jgi:hypothetical protein